MSQFLRGVVRRTIMSKRKAVPSSGDAAGAEVTTLKKKTSLVREVYPRDVILPKDLPAGDYLKVISWNIPGLRSAVKNHRDIIESLLGKHRPDVLCLQVILVVKFVDCL